MRFDVGLKRMRGNQLLNFPFAAAEILKEAREVTNNIIALCDEMLAEPGKAGRWRVPGKVTCAGIVIAAWTLVKGKAPRANNKRLQEACEAYWQACGGEPLSDKQHLANWLRPIREALAIRSSTQLA
jgi:hypothetical protein